MDSNSWRFTALSARLMFVDAYAVFALLILIVHISSETFLATILVILALTIAERKGLSPHAFLLYLRAQAGQFFGGGTRCLPDFQRIKMQI